MVDDSKNESFAQALQAIVERLKDSHRRTLEESHRVLSRELASCKIENNQLRNRLKDDTNTGGTFRRTKRSTSVPSVASGGSMYHPHSVMIYPERDETDSIALDAMPASSAFKIDHQNAEAANRSPLRHASGKRTAPATPMGSPAVMIVNNDDEYGSQTIGQKPAALMRAATTSSKYNFGEAITDDSSSDGHEYSIHVEWKASKLRRASNLTMFLGGASENQALKMFSPKNWGEERTNNELSFRFMWLPSSGKNIAWDLVGLLLIMYDVFVIPLDFFNPPANSFTDSMSWIIRLFWTFDLAHNFGTGYVDQEGELVMDVAMSAKRYATTWLPFDVLCVTLDWVTAAQTASIGGVFRGVRLIAVPRSVRFLRIFKLLQTATNSGRFQEIFGNTGSDQSDLYQLIMGITRSIAFLLWMAHLIACTWYGIGSSGEGGNTWVQYHQLQDARLYDRYVWSLHWSLANFTGELIFSPRNVAERTFACVVLVFTFLYSAHFVSSFTTDKTHLMMVKKKQSGRLTALRQYLLHHNISKLLAVRIQHNAQHLQKERSQYSEEGNIEMLKFISEPLRAELRFEVHAKTLVDHPFFERYSAINPAGIRRVCDVAISRKKVSKGDVVFSSMETPEEMFFVIEGSLSYIQKDREVSLECPGWAAEHALWTDWMHCGTLLAQTNCTLMVLDARKFREIVSPFPSSHAARYAQHFVNQLNTVHRTDQSDLRYDQFRKEIMSLDVIVRNAFDDGDMLSSERSEVDPSDRSRRSSLASSRSGQGILSESLGGAFSGRLVGFARNLVRTSPTNDASHSAVDHSSAFTPQGGRPASRAVRVRDKNHNADARADDSVRKDPSLESMETMDQSLAIEAFASHSVNANFARGRKISIGETLIVDHEETRH